MSNSRTGFFAHPLVQLTLVRFREFIREPEAVFWIFLFPILLAGGLGLAFRSTPQQTLRIGAATDADRLGIAAALKEEPALIVDPLEEAAGMAALRNGDIAVLVLAPNPWSLEIRYDDTRPDARTARGLALDALQRTSGRKDPLQVKDVVVREKGSRYIDFVIPGLLGMNLMGSGIWGVGFGIVDARKRKLLKRLIATPMSKAHYLASYLIHRLLLLTVEVIDHRGLRPLGVRRASARLAAAAHRHLPAGLAQLRRAGPARGLARAHHGGRIGPHEPGDAADVDPLRGVLLVGQLPGGDAAVHQVARPSPRSTTRCAPTCSRASRSPPWACPFWSCLCGSSCASAWRFDFSAGSSYGSAEVRDRPW